MAQEHRVEPSDAPGTARRAAKLNPGFAQTIREFAGYLRGKRPRANPRRIGLRDAEHGFELTGRDPRAAEDGARAAVRRGNVGISTMIDIEHRAVGAFEQHALAGSDRAVQKGRRIAKVALEAGARFQHRGDDFLRT